MATIYLCFAARQLAGVVGVVLNDRARSRGFFQNYASPAEAKTSPSPRILISASGQAREVRDVSLRQYQAFQYFFTTNRVPSESRLRLSSV